MYTGKRRWFLATVKIPHPAQNLIVLAKGWCDGLHMCVQDLSHADERYSVMSLTLAWASNLPGNVEPLLVDAE